MYVNPQDDASTPQRTGADDLTSRSVGYIVLFLVAARVPLTSLSANLRCTARRLVPTR